MGSYSIERFARVPILSKTLFFSKISGSYYIETPRTYVYGLICIYIYTHTQGVALRIDSKFDLLGLF